MKRFFPRFNVIGTCVCEPDGEYEGKCLSIHWLGWVFEITVAKWEPRS